MDRLVGGEEEDGEEGEDVVGAMLNFCRSVLFHSACLLLRHRPDTSSPLKCFALVC